ncbi:MAG: cobyrinate a,c-diamide synthase, partial [Dehalococcoidia bacterium]|nr:cobyrinate a,c-diamide synthase [Dehalococcoidia bacterium]
RHRQRGGQNHPGTGLAMAMADLGLKVQPFKAGPDYIDPTYHTKAAGTPSRNLDTWLLSPESTLELFSRAMRGKDIALVEGVMGLYDGRSPTTGEGSTAELAKLLAAPTVLVVDAAGAARSLAAMVSGYRDFDPDLNLAGAILNNVSGERHFKLCKEAIESGAGVPVFGYLPRRDDLRLRERHLGLIPTVEEPAETDFYERLSAQVKATTDIPGLLRLAGNARVPTLPSTKDGKSGLFPERPDEIGTARVRVAVARDKAFSFYYQDSLDLLEAWGGELVPFSPLADSRLPPALSGIYLGGGFPELYAAELAANETMRREIREAAERQLPVYAECGGLMYLGRSIRDFEGREHAMVGAFPFSSHLEGKKLTLGYRQMRALEVSPLLRRGEEVRGHEFHWSAMDANGMEMNAYQVLAPHSGREGFLQGNTLASYIHLHMGSLPGMAPRFIECCRRYRDYCHCERSEAIRPP